jgi:2',3'-cyclic-nucleotide 2'-phosphodiesterase (5'-nucleotidase family)
LKVDLTRSSSGDSLFQKRLWNLVTDAVLAYAKSELNWNVNVALLNSGGLRRDLYAGPISVRDVYELLPFENFLVRIDLDEEGFQDMVDYLKAKNQPQSGLILGFKRDSLQRVELKTSASAHIVTINYLADGGDRMDFLSKGDREDSTILIRDAFMWYLKKNSILLPSFDNRTYEID